MSSCGHSWQPIQNWYGRYRCIWCKAIGYRQLVNGGARGNPLHIVVYVCKRAGCHEPAIAAGKKPQLCAEHSRCTIPHAASTPVPEVGRGESTAR